MPFPKVEKIMNTVASCRSISVKKHTNADVVAATKGNFPSEPVHITAVIDNSITVVFEDAPAQGIRCGVTADPGSLNTAFIAGFDDRSKYVVERMRSYDIGAVSHEDFEPLGHISDTGVDSACLGGIVISRRDGLGLPGVASPDVWLGLVGFGIHGFKCGGSVPHSGGLKNILVQELGEGAACCGLHHIAGDRESGVLIGVKTALFAAYFGFREIVGDDGLERKPFFNEVGIGVVGQPCGVGKQVAQLDALGLLGVFEGKYGDKLFDFILPVKYAFFYQNTAQNTGKSF